ncbi:MAG: nickel pincer cofactor biosynthesis protein LarC [Deltaproteobacteria bacterium]|nr:nickel pincer cofactor biosynthesis protein LarC [Deltaproteobacteria bacterium]
MLLKDKNISEKKVLYFDCYSGISGDMIIAALLDLGVPFKIVEDGVKSVLPSGVVLRHEHEMRNSIKVSRFFVDIDMEDQPHRHFSDIRTMIEDSSLKQSVKDLSVKIFLTIAKAEAAVHGVSIDEVHFHEVGAADSIADIIGAAVAIDYLDAEIVSSPIPFGCGQVLTQHGLLPLPAPATVEILKDIPVYGTKIESELTTPTGAAVIKTTAVKFSSMPSMIPVGTGTGAGSRKLKDRPGILRVTLGTLHPVDTLKSLKIIETNIDDMTGEMAGHALTELINEGALDAWIESIIMKKGRPGLKISVLSKEDDYQRLVKILLLNTTTLGVRIYDVNRIEMERLFEQVDTKWGSVRVKIGKLGKDINNIAVEFDDCSRLAKENKVSIKEIIDEAKSAALKFV